MFESLHPLSDSEIVSGSQAARAQEHGGTIAILGFIAEVDRRKIYLTMGYSSLFDYCTKFLEESESAANRRITAARCVVKFPQVMPLLESKDINLSTIGKVAKILTVENCDVVLERIRRKSIREAEAVAAEYQPVPSFPKESVKTMVKMVRTPTKAAPAPRDLELLGEIHLRSGGKESSSVEESTPASAEEVQFEKRSLVKISADDEFMSMLARIKELASHQLRAGMGMQDVLKLAMRYYIRHKDPHARAARRKERGEIRDARPKATSVSPRFIPAALRDRVHVRDGRCTYVAADGKRCNSPHTLQIDHVTPVARKGAAVVENLRLLCAEHNRMEADKLMGVRRRE